MLTEEGMTLQDEIVPLWQSLNQVLLNTTTESLRISVIPELGRHSIQVPVLVDYLSEQYRTL